ncbi:MAG: hypothetical protein JNK00_01865 [Flavipsychrobacter sp.]|nr:hypothetical protein [Flavipsychrobacter sp.]
MKKILVFLGLGIMIASCQEANSGTDNPEADTASVAHSEPVKDTLPPNVGTWNASVKPSKGKGGVLTVTGMVNVSDAKGKAKLTKKTTTGVVNPGELFLQISHEPKADNKQQVMLSYTEKLDSISKYNKITVQYKDKFVALIPSIEQGK